MEHEELRDNDVSMCKVKCGDVEAGRQRIFEFSAQMGIDKNNSINRRIIMKDTWELN